jgi:hypothetical protein
MEYANFPEDATDQDIYDMMLTDCMLAICSKCKFENQIPIEDEFKCGKCGIILQSPFMNPEEVDCDRRFERE